MSAEIFGARAKISIIDGPMMDEKWFRAISPDRGSCPLAEGGLQVGRVISHIAVMEN
jgi:hypothetical protein